MSARLGFVMLAHTALDRVAQVARHLATAGCPVVIHVDADVSARDHAALLESLKDLDTIRFARRRHCEWGTWSLVHAMQVATQQMLDDFPSVRHVYSMSGACLPLRPIAELAAWLKEHPETDFIESVNVRDVEWTKGGLSRERFWFRFPFAFKRQKWLFDSYVRLQRRLRVRRKLPDGLVPHLGSQWWCLTRATLERILTDPERETYDQFFRRVWIPDESYFQSLVRLHSRKIDSRSLTLSKFDHHGRPHILYDDHLQLLTRSECFFGRKVWPGADRLYDHFLRKDNAARSDMIEPQPGRVDRHFARATQQRINGRAGLYMVSRFPGYDTLQGRSARPYAVFQGFADLFPGFEDWLTRTASITQGADGAVQVHGHLFGPLKVEFADRARVFTGALSDSASLRDYNPRAFLANLIWATQGTTQAFQYGPADTQGLKSQLVKFMAGDANARISVISGAWLIPMWASGADFTRIRHDAAQLQQIETQMLRLLQGPELRAQVRVWTLADAVEDPATILRQSLAMSLPGLSVRDVPDMAKLDGFEALLRDLRNHGMQPVLVGDYAPPQKIGGP